MKKKSSGGSGEKGLVGKARGVSQNQELKGTAGILLEGSPMGSIYYGSQVALVFENGWSEWSKKVLVPITAGRDRKWGWHFVWWSSDGGIPFRLIIKIRLFRCRVAGGGMSGVGGFDGQI